MLYRFFSAILIITLLSCAQEDNGASAAAAEPGAQPAPAAERTPAEIGRSAFSACAVCHSAREGDNARVGPSLYGVYGREAGSVESFAYSPAMRAAGLVWNDETLDAYLENPRNVVPGNRMAFAGERNPERRAAIIAYLKTLTPEAAE